MIEDDAEGTPVRVAGAGAAIASGTRLSGLVDNGVVPADDVREMEALEAGIQMACEVTVANLTRYFDHFLKIVTPLTEQKILGRLEGLTLAFGLDGAVRKQFLYEAHAVKLDQPRMHNFIRQLVYRSVGYGLPRLGKPKT